MTGESHALKLPMNHEPSVCFQGKGVSDVVQFLRAYPPFCAPAWMQAATKIPHLGKQTDGHGNTIPHGRANGDTFTMALLGPQQRVDRALGASRAPTARENLLSTSTHPVPVIRQTNLSNLQETTDSVS